MPFHAPGLDFLKIEHLVDQACQTFGFLDDNGCEVYVFFDVDLRIGVQDFGNRSHRRQRRAQFVGDGGDEFVFEAVEFLQAFIGGFQFGRGSLQFAAVSDNLPGFIQDFHNLFNSEGFFLDDHGYHSARRGRSDRSGQQLLDMVDQCGIGVRMAVQVKSMLAGILV